MVIHLIIITVLIGIKVGWDWSQKKSGRIINHSRSAFFDIVLYSVSAVAFLKGSVWFYITAVGTSLAYRWIVFDIAFNLVNGWRWDHLGNSSKLDIFLKKFKYPIIIKLILFIFGVICMILL